MKKIITVLLMISFNSFAQEFAMSSERSGGGGNGGGAWVCQNKDQLKSIRWARLVDLYEAEKEFLLEMKSFRNRDYQEIVDFQKVRLFSINKNLYGKLESYFEDVDENMREVDADLEIIDDSLYRVRPPVRDCLGGTIEYVQLANYTHYGAILINENLFNSPKLSEVDKASLIFHEAIYAYFRDRYGDDNSSRAREIVGLIFSTLRNSEISDKIDAILGYISGGVTRMKFVKIPAGTFTMGSPKNEAGRDDDEAERKVRLTRDFEMMTTEVTQLMYFEVTGKNPSKYKKQRNCPLTFTSAVSHTTGQLVTLCPNNPVEQVSHNDVLSFIAVINAKMGMNYRLPTEAEWEYAARGGTQTAYSFGNSAAFLSEYTIYNGNSGGKVHPVGPLRTYANKANAYGLYDMHGNVCEWVQDWYTKSPVGTVNPVGPFRTGSYRVIRGGSWGSIAGGLRSANRLSSSPSIRYYSVGFRLVRTLP